MNKIVLIAACLLGLAACQPGEPLNNVVAVGEAPVTSVAGNPSDPSRCGLAAGTLADERALFAAETAYNVPAHAYVALDEAGRLTPELKARVRPLLVSSYNYLLAARTAYRLGDVCSLANAIIGVRKFALDAKAVLPN